MKRMLTTAAVIAALVSIGALAELASAGGRNTASTPPAGDPMIAARAPTADGVQLTILAGGCFWGMEQLLREIPGVIDTEVGYTGGLVVDPTYQDLKTGLSGHAEAVRVQFDPQLLSYDDLLRWYFRMHDPTTTNRQGNDVGTQYRSVIFVFDEQQRATATRVRVEVDAAGHYRAPIVTAIEEASTFYPAEPYHQDYLVHHPNGYTCHYLRDW